MRAFFALALATLGSGDAVQDLLQAYLQTYSKLIVELGDAYEYSPSNPAKTQLQTAGYMWTNSAGWTSGFYPGLLWQLAHYTNDQLPGMGASPLSVGEVAAKYTAGMEGKKTYTGSHDIGFMVFGSFGSGIQLNGTNSTYQDVIVEAAHSLAVRYSPTVGMLRSWGSKNDQEHFQVIIDNLMNLELMYWSANATGNTTLSDIADEHVARTNKLWIREDGSTAHLCVFEPSTGDLQSPCTGTPQGLSANSTWARGQAWGIYGNVLAYRYRRNKQYLDAAEKMAAFYLVNVGESLVPKWDFDVQAPQDFADTSAAAIVASAFLELAVYVQGDYEAKALAILESLNASFRTDNTAPEAVLWANRHDCGADSCSIIETDYYAFEALRRVRGQFPPGVLDTAVIV